MGSKVDISIKKGCGRVFRAKTAAMEGREEKSPIMLKKDSKRSVQVYIFPTQKKTEKIKKCISPKGK